MTVKIGKKIKGLIKRDNDIMLRTALVNYPFVVQKGDGDYTYDVEGNRFIDFSSFISVYNFGVNANKEIRQAVHRQVDTLMHGAFSDYYSEGTVDFAENLVTMFPKGFGRVFLCNSGTEANEAAIKSARLLSKRQYMFSFYGSFHGRTMGSLGVTASKSVHREGLGPFGPVVKAPYAYCYRCPFKLEYPSCGMACVDYIKDYPLSKEVGAKEVAGIIIEPVQGEGGYIVPPKDFIKGVKEIAEDNGIMLISDEIQSGYMRTGKFLALDNFGVEADIYTMAKSLGGGLPLGAAITRTSLGNIPAGSHGTTFGGNLAVVAGANASLNYVKRNKRMLEASVAKKNKYIMKKLNHMREDYEIVGDVRGLGLMIGVEFVKDKKTKTPGKEIREKVVDKCFNNNLLMLHAGTSTVRIIPPITMTDENIENGMDIFEDAVKEVNKTR